jgi:hypothetical protein
MFRALVAINWDALSLASEWAETRMIRMRLYMETMAYAMQASGWMD